MDLCIKAVKDLPEKWVDHGTSIYVADRVVFAANSRFIPIIYENNEWRELSSFPEREQ